MPVSVQPASLEQRIIVLESTIERIEKELGTSSTALAILQNAPSKPYKGPFGLAAKTPLVFSVKPVAVIFEVALPFSKAVAVTFKVNGVAVTGVNIGTETNSEIKSIPILLELAGKDSVEWEGAPAGITVNYRYRIKNE